MNIFKSISVLAVVALVMSCQNETKVAKDYAVIHGKVTNPIDGLSLRLYDPVSSKSAILALDKDGVFRDTLRLENPTTYTLVYDNIISTYLQNDMDLEINFDTKNFDKTLKFTGNGHHENQFLRFLSKHNAELYGDDYRVYFSLEQDAFDKKTNAFL